jgi:myo-inositol-1(or 4)-monophosphatase
MARSGGVDWEKILLGATERVQKAVARVDSQGDRSSELGRGASGDITLVADSEAEKELVSALSEAASVRVLTEEAGEVGVKGADLTAILDPVDGSSNFSRGIPFYCTSVAIADGAGLETLRWAAVRNLVTGDVYYAERGRGATKNGRQIRTSGVRELKHAIAAVDVSRAGVPVVHRLAPLIAALKREVHMGANALELCLVAEGATDAFVDIRGSMRIVDFAAAYLISLEAGAVVTSPEGGRLDLALDLRSRFSYVASANQELHREVLAKLSVG